MKLLECGCAYLTDPEGRDVPVAVCATHGMRLADFPPGSFFFGSMLVATLTWTANLVLCVQMHER